MNGVDSEEKLINSFGEKHVLYGYMRMSVVMKDGKADFDPYWGKIHFGEKMNKEYSERVLAVKEVFDKADIPYEIDEDMLKGIWFKFMCNIGENMTCALLGIPFGGFHVSDHANWVRIEAMKEIAAIAQKKGINIGKEEIDMFAGTVIQMGRELGIPTPICEMFYHGIHVLEEKNDGFIRL